MCDVTTNAVNTRRIDFAYILIVLPCVALPLVSARKNTLQGNDAVERDIGLHVGMRLASTLGGNGCSGHTVRRGTGISGRSRAGFRQVA